MKTLIKNEFRQTRKLLLIWLGIMLLLCGFCYFELLSLQDSLDEMAAMVGQFPRLIMIMFGVKGDLTTSTGWYVCIYFWEGQRSCFLAAFLRQVIPSTKRRNAT